MLESSKDLLFIVLAFCALWLTIFLCWMIYYVAMILKNANEIVHEVRERLASIAEALDFVRSKVDGVAGAMGFLTDSIGSMVGKKFDFDLDLGEKKPKKKTKKK